MIYKKLLCCVSLLFLPSCASMTDSAPAPEQLTDLLKQNLVLLSDNNFEKLPPSLKENEIIFLGETHKVKPLQKVAAELAVYLATYKPVVYACELAYSFGPFMEAASLGNPKTFQPIGIPDCIQAFNFNQTADKKILMTAIDVEHAMYDFNKNKNIPVIFLQELAGRSTSDIASEEINKEVAQFTAQDTYDKMNRYLKKLKKVFQPHLDTFSSKDQEEILFSLDLLQASNRFYQYTTDKGIRGFFLTSTGWNIRAKYFTKTIERAYRKAQNRKALLLCRVGAPHAYLDRKMEARYFAKKYSPTRGKVASIGLVPLYYDTNETNDNVTEKSSDIDSIVMTLMKDDEYSYLSLFDLQKNTNNSFKWSKYYGSSGPKFDGLLFVRIEKNSN